MMNGELIPAGLGHSVVRADLDFETYSEAGYAWDEDRVAGARSPGLREARRACPSSARRITSATRRLASCGWPMT